MFEFVNGAPFSSAYQDIYFSSDHGLDESSHVFIEGNRLLESWQDKNCFVIGETGFGTGLNFLNVWDQWQKATAKPEVLHFISVEKHPLAPYELRESHRLFPSLAPLSAQLVQKYPINFSGFHRTWFDDGRICLTLCFMDVCSALSELDAKIDCWFLDGFSPAKNPEMWSQKVFRHLARLGHLNTTVATFTSAGHVRRGLIEAGFAVTKVPGFGRKREMTAGLLKHPPRVRNLEPWRSIKPNPVQTKSALIIGAGIAGSQIAYRLAARGFTVDVLEQYSQAGMAASGNPRGIVTPKLSAKHSLEEEFSVSGFLKAVEQLSELAPVTSAWSRCGSLDLVTNQRQDNQWQRILERNLPSSLVQAVDSKKASEIAGIPITQRALYFPLAGWIDTKQIIHALLDHDNIRVAYNRKVTALEQVRSGWELTIENESGQRERRAAEIVVIAGGACLTELCAAPLPVDIIGGQTSFARSTEHSAKLRCVLQHEGYITPSVNSLHLVGATFQREIKLEEAPSLLNQKNFDQLEKHLPNLAAQLDELSTAHFGHRAATKTRFPLIGAIPNMDFFNPEKKEKTSVYTGTPFLPGLYVFGAFGSRGFSTTAFAAEILCSEILGEPAPTRLSLRRAIEPVGWINKLAN